jgi:cell division protein FtsQ
MDGRGRLAQSLKRSGKNPENARRRPRARGTKRAASVRSSRLGLLLHRWFGPVFQSRIPRGVGVAATAFLLLASGIYGVVIGGHGSMAVAHLKDVRDAAANTVGLRIAAVALTGNKHVTREEILAMAGVTGRASLLFLDADAARTRLQGNPWISEATVLKLFPDRLHITVKEREVFALWQKDGKVSVIAPDGTVVEPYVASRFTGLPLVVGRGAEVKARQFLALLDRYPQIRGDLRAATLVAERRWNVRLKNGLDVRLPETNVARALDTLIALDRDKKILSRDITSIDLRLPDRVTVRLNEAAAQARNEALKEREKKSKAKGKGGEA